jgi:SpoIIAA-like
MIVVEEDKDLLKVSVYAELSLADFREFETAVNNELRRAPKLKLLLNLSKMSGYTVDVMWEDIQFTRTHARDFKRIAVVTDSMWVSWLGWLPSAFTDAEIRHFEDLAAADAWLQGR